MAAAAASSAAAAAPPAAARGRCIARIRLPPASSAAAAAPSAAAHGRCIARIRLPPASSAAAPPAAARGRCIARIRLPPAWTAEEDARLERLAKENGFHHWHRVARQMPGRSPRFCRDRWRDHLARHVYHRPFTARDDDELQRLVARFGSSGHWKDIGCAVYGRTSRVMKRRWKELRKKKSSTGGKIFYCPPALPSDDDGQEEGLDMESDETLQQDHPSYADDVLASGFASFSLATGAAVDPRAGSLALGFACMTV